MAAPKNNKEENKPKMSLIPLDLLMELLPPAYTEGIEKYFRESWREGFKISVMQDALLRHLTAFIYNHEDYDPEAEAMGIKKLHLGAVIVCAICMYDTIKNHPEMDDRIKIKETTKNTHDKDYTKINKIPKEFVEKCAQSADSLQIQIKNYKRENSLLRKALKDQDVTFTAI